MCEDEPDAGTEDPEERGTGPSTGLGPRCALGQISVSQVGVCKMLGHPRLPTCRAFTTVIFPTRVNEQKDLNPPV